MYVCMYAFEIIITVLNLQEDSLLYASSSTSLSLVELSSLSSSSLFARQSTMVTLMSIMPLCTSPKESMELLLFLLFFNLSKGYDIRTAKEKIKKTQPLKKQHSIKIKQLMNTYQVYQRVVLPSSICQPRPVL